MNMLIHIYAVNSQPAAIKLDPESGSNGHITNGHSNGHVNGQIRGGAEEFELDGLTSDDDEADEEERLVKRER